jgi:hypothetical protein
MKQAKRIRDLYGRGSAHLSRFAECNSAADLELALGCFRELDGMVRADCSQRTAIEAQLCFCLAGRYRLSASATDRDLAIDRLAPLIGRPDPGGALDGLRIVLGQLLAARAMTKPADDLQDLRAAIGLLGTAQASPTIAESQRREALRQLERAKIMLTILRSWEAVAQGRLPDLAELRAAATRQRLSSSDEHSAPLSLALGLSLGLAFRWHGDGLAQDPREAIEYLTGGLEVLPRDAPWRDYALMLLALLLAASDFLRSNPGHAARASRFAERGLRDGAEDSDAQGAFHLIAYCAELAIAEHQGRPDGERAVLVHLDQAHQFLSGDTELSAALLAVALKFLNDRAQASALTT